MKIASCSIKTCLASADNSCNGSTNLSVCPLIVLLVNSVIEIFVRSFAPYMDVETCKDMSQHPFCAPESAEGLISGALSKFKGRVFPEADSTILEHVLQLMGKTNESVKIYDLSRVTDSLRAIRRGIRSTPVAIINKEKYESLEEILRAISNLKQS